MTYWYFPFQSNLTIGIDIFLVKVEIHFVKYLQFYYETIIVVDRNELIVSKPCRMRSGHGSKCYVWNGM